jgi:hypothetical protein
MLSSFVAIFRAAAGALHLLFFSTRRVALSKLQQISMGRILAEKWSVSTAKKNACAYDRPGEIVHEYHPGSRAGDGIAFRHFESSHHPFR